MFKDSKIRRFDKKEVADRMFRNQKRVDENAKKWFKEVPYQLKVQEGSAKNENK